MGQRKKRNVNRDEKSNRGKNKRTKKNQSKDIVSKACESTPGDLLLDDEQMVSNSCQQPPKDVREGSTVTPLKLDFTTLTNTKIQTPKALKVPLSAKQLSTLKLARNKKFETNISVREPSIQGGTPAENGLIKEMFLLVKSIV